MDPGQVVEIAGLCLDPLERNLTVDGQALELTQKEFDLLYTLAGNPGRVFSRDYLLDEIWGYRAESYDRTIDTHIYRLRQKLGSKSEAASRIVAARGVGYKFTRE